MLRERASHEGDNARQSRLVDIETIEESFDDNYGLAVIHGPVQIEEDQRFPEPGRKTISRFGLANRSSCVSDKAAILIVNGYHDAPLHVALSRKDFELLLLSCSVIRVIGILNQLEFVINCNNPKIHVVTVQDAVYLARYPDRTCDRT